MSRTLHLFGTDWCAMMVPIQVIRWYRMQCYDGTDSCAIVVPIRRYCQTYLLLSLPHLYPLRSSDVLLKGHNSIWLSAPFRNHLNGEGVRCLVKARTLYWVSCLLHFLLLPYVICFKEGFLGKKSLSLIIPTACRTNVKMNYFSFLGVTVSFAETPY